MLLSEQRRNMEDFEINSNESEKRDKDKVKTEVNNNRNSNNNNNKYTYEQIGVELENKTSEGHQGEIRNGHSKEEVDACENMDLTRKSENLKNGEYYRLDVPCAEAPLDPDDTQNNSSENGELVEEIILLPSNFISDDELSSNSDDCVYAYRGGHIDNVDANLVNLEPVNLVDDGQEEETDFLEMDFDPEPNSEIENFIEDEHHFNHLEANFFTLRSEEGLRELPCVSQLRQNGTESPLDTFQRCTLEKQAEPEDRDSPKPGKSSDSVYTGAKPKLVTSSSAHKLSSSTSYSKDTFDSDSNRPESSYKPSSAPLRTSTNIDDQQSCLECTEAEFIFQTKPEFSFERKCRRHRNKEVPSLSYSSPDSCLPTPTLQTSSLPDPSKASSSSDSPKVCHQPAASHNIESMVTIYSINCDYETIVEATNLIGVTINTEILQHYFDNLADEETATMSVPEYLLYVSKRNCNYKRLIDVIKAACQGPVDIHFYPVTFPFVLLSEL